MGKHGLDTILSMAALESYTGQLPPDNLARQFDFAYLAAISEALEDMYGTRGGRGIALRIGRATFDKGLNTFGALSGMAHPAFQRLPLAERSRLGVAALAAVFSKFSDQQVTVETLDDHFRMTVDPSPMAWGRTTEKPVCHAVAGMIQGGLRWASGGHEYHVQEMSCRAAGGEVCVFKVNRNPIGGGNLG